MYREILLGISGVALYPIVSLLLFVTTFGAVLVQVARMDRRRIQQLAALPFEDDAPASDRRGE
ncbi:MAG: cbb3-type cytochrome c oxidase subunit 3 [Vicinamibacterales bacterium]